MSESKKSSWDRERVTTILHEEIGDPFYIDHGPEGDAGHATDKLTELLGSVRAEAIGWAWTEACSQHDKGLDPKRFEVPLLMDKANADLNPERDK